LACRLHLGLQISMSKRVVMGEAKAMRTRLNEVVRLLTSIDTADDAKALYDKAEVRVHTLYTCGVGVWRWSAE
jgi:hypothetical protein